MQLKTLTLDFYGPYSELAAETQVPTEVPEGMTHVTIGTGESKVLAAHDAYNMIVDVCGFSHQRCPDCADFLGEVADAVGKALPFNAETMVASNASLYKVYCRLAFEATE